MLTFTSVVPWCHHITVSSSAWRLWHGCLFQHHSQVPPYEMILCYGSAPETDLPGQEPRESTAERLPQSSLPAPWTEVFWMRPLGPTNQRLHWRAVSWGYFQPCLVNRAMISGAFMCYCSFFNFLPWMPPFWTYLGPDGMSFAGKVLPAVNSQVLMSRPALPSRAGRTSPNDLSVSIFSLWGKWAAVSIKTKSLEQLNCSDALVELSLSLLL